MATLKYWDGTTWQVIAGAPGGVTVYEQPSEPADTRVGTMWIDTDEVPPTATTGGPAGGDLSGTFPNPTVIKASSGLQVTGNLQFGAGGPMLYNNGTALQTDSDVVFADDLLVNNTLSVFGRVVPEALAIPYYAAGNLPAVANNGDICYCDPGVTGASECLCIFNSATGGIGAWSVYGCVIDGTQQQTASGASATAWRKLTTSPTVMWTYAGSYECSIFWDATVSAAGLTAIGWAPIDLAATGSPPSGQYCSFTCVAGQRCTFLSMPYRVNTSAGTKGFDMRCYSVAAGTFTNAQNARLTVHPVYMYGTA